MNLTSPKNWKTVKLGDIAVFNYGKSLVSTSRMKGDFPVYGSSGITGYHNEALVNESGYIIGRKGSVGTIYFSDKPFWPIDTVYYVPEKDLKCDFNFFFYLLKTLGLDKLNFDSAIPGLNREMAYSLSFQIPESFEDQREIAAILGSLDDKIELLRRENKTLEIIAQTLFKEWFVDFRFPGYEGVKMVDGVPEGWKVGKLGEFINLRGGLSYDGNLISDKGVPMLTMGFVSGTKRFEWSGLRFYKGPYKDQNKVKVGDLVIATRDVTQDRILIGSPALIPNLLNDQEIIAATNLYIVENINYLSNKFIYWLMKTPDYRERIVGACKGTTIVMITKDSILDYEFVVPPESVAKKFNEINDQILNKCEMIDSEIQTLSRLRDDLLNKIFNV